MRLARSLYPITRESRKWYTPPAWEYTLSCYIPKTNDSLSAAGYTPAATMIPFYPFVRQQRILLEYYGAMEPPILGKWSQYSGKGEPSGTLCRERLLT